MQVRDLMTREVVSVPSDASLATAVERMVDEGIGSVIVTHDGDPAGIVTESDALRAVLLANVSPDAIPVARVASSPLKTIAQAQSVRAAIDRMIDANIEQLPVVDGFELVGIITLSDVARNYSILRKEAGDMQSGRGEWESED